MKKNIGIIGAGIGGLTAACLLAKDGHDVTVWEKNETPGGKMNIVRAESFRFDTGPSLITMPFVIDRLFEYCDAKRGDYLELVPVDPVCRYFWKDGARFDCFSDLPKVLDQLDEIAPDDEEAWVQFLGYAAGLYEKTAGTFLFNPLEKWSDLGSLKKSDVFRIDSFTTVSKRIDKTFKSPYLRQLFKRFTTYNGSSPYQAPATLNVIAYVELCQGGFYIRGGIYKLAEALIDLGKSLGVNYVFGKDAEITAIKPHPEKTRFVSEVEFSNLKTSHVDILFSNADATETNTKLLPDSIVPYRKKERIRKTEPSCSGFVLMLGCSKQYPELKHHNVFFSEDYESEFADIFDKKVMPEDPTIYIANTSYTDADHAPENGSNLFILVNAPYLSDAEVWTGDRAKEYGDKIISELEKRGLSGLSDSIKFREHITPAHFYDLYRSNRGSIYGTSSNNKFAAFLRPRNKSEFADNLYLTGGSTHPGGGVPLAMLSAMHAHTIFKRDQK